MNKYKIVATNWEGKVSEPAGRFETKEEARELLSKIRRSFGLNPYGGTVFYISDDAFRINGLLGQWLIEYRIKEV